MIQVPAGLPASRTTKYDRIFHTLNAATLHPAPDYSGGSRSAFSLAGLKRDSTLSTAFDKSLCSAISSAEIEVFTAPELDDSRVTQFVWGENVEGLGTFMLKASTDAVSVTQITAS